VKSEWCTGQEREGKTLNNMSQHDSKRREWVAVMSNTNLGQHTQKQREREGVVVFRVLFLVHYSLLLPINSYPPTYPSSAIPPVSSLYCHSTLSAPPVAEGPDQMAPGGAGAVGEERVVYTCDVHSLGATHEPCKGWVSGYE
jgi:hypothetical protein